MPRIPAARVREGLLHPDRAVRRTALRYFVDAFSPDPAVMPTAIEAVRRYGRKDAFEYGFAASALSQSPETIRWAIDELRAVPPIDDAYRNGIVRLLVEAHPELLAPLADEVLAAGLGEEHAARVERRLAYRSKTGDELWDELEALCRRHAEVEDGWEFPWDHGDDIVGALGLQGDRHVARLMEILPLVAADDDAEAFWRESLVTRLAGELRHEPAVPLVLAKFEADADILNEEAERALIRIGSDAVVAAVAAAYGRTVTDNRIYLGGVLGNVRSDAAVEAGLAAAAAETDDGLKSFLLANLVSQLSTEVNDIAREYLRDGDDIEVLSVLVPACELTGQDYPELPAWREALEPPEQPPSRYRPAPPPPPEWQPTPPITRDEARVGRNDPCPCGSGKKYKKCCLPTAGAGPAAW